MSATTEMATVGGGCYWCLEACFEQLVGVENVASGFTGGGDKKPTYESVCSGRTGHAEVVQVTFDPEKITYRELLEVFFAIHDPTTLNRQGADAGTQYRSAIFYHNAEQKAVAETAISELTEEKAWADPIVTEIAPLTQFFVADDYHQGYFRSNPRQPYCMAVIAPKIVKTRKSFANRLKA